MWFWGWGDGKIRLEVKGCQTVECMVSGWEDGKTRLGVKGCQTVKSAWFGGGEIVKPG